MDTRVGRRRAGHPFTRASRSDRAAPQLVPVQTALSATTISGYVDTSAVWNPGTGNANPAPYAFNAGKQDGFNLDSVDLRIEKGLDETPNGRPVMSLN
jgi:hypothetical protein